MALRCKWYNIWFHVSYFSAWCLVFVSGMGRWWVTEGPMVGPSEAYAIHPTHIVHATRVWTSQQNIMPGLHCNVNTRQVSEHPDCTIFKVLTILKWRMMTTVNRKLLENQRVQNRFASYEVLTVIWS